ncbi:MAG: ComEA family DNA-binding protein, partial [Caldilinea sp.]|nr:ComEA family DNA-binding protein [Caldilinea sp.]MDW8442507.1 ComEA family DNA-binding protein [Caldilineaceae bacterium]
PTPGPIAVYVSGAVEAPGVFTLPPEARIVDAVTAAGGLREDADPARINLAARLFDAAQVHVPALGEPSGHGAPAGLSGLLPTPTPQMRSVGVELSSQGLIDLNTATRAELESLPGIGPSKAQAIIDNRPYATVDQLERVPGIGPATVNRLRPLVTVQSQP